MGTSEAARNDLIARVGTTREDDTPRIFRAGDLSVEFQGGALRYLRYRGQELVRAISFLVRDENWGTFGASISDLHSEERSDGFRLTFQSQCGEHGDDLRMQTTIAGYADGRLDFEVRAEVQRSFSTNRTGFVVLHPLEVSGLPVMVEQVDGRRLDAKFPEQINPLQPFMEIRALTTRHTAELSAQVRMEGDIFEMEDQRNWTDASFKTYVRPLALPWPYPLEKGIVLSQAVRVKVSAASATNAASDVLEQTAMIRVDVDAADDVALPHLGISVRATDLPESLPQANRLAALGVSYFIACLDLRSDDIAVALQGFADLSRDSGVPHVLEIVLSNDPSPQAVKDQLSAVAKHLKSAPQSLQLSSAADLKAVLPGSPWPSSPSFETMLSTARVLFPGVAVGAGSFAFFTEFNRKRPAAELLDYVSFTTCPIVHAADDRSVMETLSTLPYIARSGQALYPTLRFRVGPSSIAVRDNPYGSAASSSRNDDQADRICLTDNDPRQRGLFAAAWNLAYFSQFALNGATHIALSELVGPRGVLIDGKPTPLFYLLQSLAQPQPQPATLQPLTVTSGRDGRRPYAHAVRSGDTLLLWFANTSAEVLEFSLSLPLGSKDVRRRQWQVGNNSDSSAPAWQADASSSLQLGPYETVQVALTLIRKSLGQ
ncbi:hypothetical protein [Glaciimonas sp. PCH181]|uniref:hypothetical protein n=1 Tax=Glaciimonas sp. PCH181 TaxID=2133943 RepID=UPI000D37B985|nr:hypothetical protein [Glaciimonas sp. PCH181]PUA19712.1 hypothetical protein C7W93_07735 [Glaciimonas sp. PCH181]